MQLPAATAASMTGKRQFLRRYSLMCVVDAAMNSGSEITPSPSRSVAWPPPFPYSSPASRLALKPSGLTIGMTIVRVLDTRSRTRASPFR